MKLPIFLTLCATLPFIVFAHGGGLTIQKESGIYTLTLDAVSEQIHPGVSERINFEIMYREGTSTVSFTHAWVRIMGPDGSFLFSGNVHAAPEGFVTGISYLFPIAGTYQITVRFLRGEEAIAETEFPVLVGGASSPENTRHWWSLAALLSVAVLLLSGFLRLIRPTRK